jgi:uncharacterized protein YcfL
VNLNINIFSLRRLNLNKNTGRSFGHFFVILIVVLGLSACQLTNSPVTSGLGVESITNETPPASYLRVDNVKLAEKLTVSDVKHRRVNELLEVNIELSSQYNKSLTLQYYFNWFDKNGFVVEGGKSPWQPLKLHGHQSTMLRGVSPSTEVTSFNVYVRTLDKNK